MRNKLTWFVVVMCLMALVGNVVAFDTDVSLALQEVIDDASAGLKKSGVSANKTVTIFSPLINGDQAGYAEGKLKIAINQAGLKYVEHKEDAFIEQIQKELATNERWNEMGIVDKKTLFLIGENMKVGEYLLYGTIREPDVNDQRIYVEIELHVSSLKTAEYIWGGTFAKRVARPDYDPGEGAISIEMVDDSVRDILKNSFQGCVDELKGNAALVGKKIALTPIGDDLEGYVQGIAKEMISSAGLTWRNLGARSRGEAFLMVEDKPQQADAVLHGAVRNLSIRHEKSDWDRETYEIYTEVQLDVQGVNGDGLWSKVITGRGEYVDQMTWWELVLHYQRILMIAGAVLLGLIVIGMFLKSTRRVR